MSGHFAHLFDWAETRLRGLGFEAAPVPHEFARCEGKADLTLTSLHLSHPWGTSARGAYLAGPRAEIINLMIYPANPARVPVYAAELVVFGRQPRVVVIDLQPVEKPLREEVDLSLFALGRRWNERFGDGGELPEWAREHFTPGCLYSRPEGLDCLADCQPALEDYFEAWTGYFPREAQPGSGREALAAYQRHHVEHTPGRRFLTTSFGSEWTERYLSEFMYA